MIEPKYLDLIHQKIDGVISASDRQKLERYLTGHPEAVQLMKELQGVCDLLDDTEEVEPPAVLRQRILSAVNFERYPLRKRPHPFVAVKEYLARRPRIGYAYAFSGGLALGLLVAALVWGGLFGRGVVERSQLSGTMAAPKTAAEFRTVTSFPIQAAGLRGRLTASTSRHQARFQFVGQSAQQVTWVLLYDQEQLTLDGLRSMKGTPLHIESSPGSFKIEWVGQTEFLLTFRYRSLTAVKMTLQLRSLSSLLYEQTLSVAPRGLDK